METESLDPCLAFAQVVEGFKVLPPCVVLGRIGQGGFGSVYRAWHLNLGIEVAVKCLQPGLGSDDPKFIARFRREAQAAAALNHANVIRVYDVANHRGLHYIVMEFVDGESCRQRLRRRGNLTVAEALAIAHGAALGLGEAHARGIVHRDVKPDNLLISRSGVVKVADLGLAKPTGDGEEGELPSLTGAGNAIGTPQYMPPEQWGGDVPVSPATDVWALGATLFYLLTGRHAIGGESLPAIMQRILSGEFPHLPIDEVPAPFEVAEVIRRATRPKPGERYPTGLEFARAIEAIGVERASLADPEAGVAPGGGEVPRIPSSLLDRISTQMAMQLGGRTENLQIDPREVPAPEAVDEPPSAAIAPPSAQVPGSGGGLRRVALGVAALLLVGAAGVGFVPALRALVFGTTDGSAGDNEQLAGLDPGNGENESAENAAVSPGAAAAGDGAEDGEDDDGPELEKQDQTPPADPIAPDEAEQAAAPEPAIPLLAVPLRIELVDEDWSTLTIETEPGALVTVDGTEIQLDPGQTVLEHRVRSSLEDPAPIVVRFEKDGFEAAERTVVPFRESVALRLVGGPRPLTGQFYEEGFGWLTDREVIEFAMEVSERPGWLIVDGERIDRPSFLAESSEVLVELSIEEGELRTIELELGRKFRESARVEIVVFRGSDPEPPMILAPTDDARRTEEASMPIRVRAESWAAAVTATVGGETHTLVKAPESDEVPSRVDGMTDSEYIGLRVDALKYDVYTTTIDLALGVNAIVVAVENGAGRRASRTIEVERLVPPQVVQPAVESEVPEPVDYVGFTSGPSRNGTGHPLRLTHDRTGIELVAVSFPTAGAPPLYAGASEVTVRQFNDGKSGSSAFKVDIRGYEAADWCSERGLSLPSRADWSALVADGSGELRNLTSGGVAELLDGPGPGDSSNQWRYRDQSGSERTWLRESKHPLAGFRVVYRP